MAVPRPPRYARQVTKSGWSIREGGQYPVGPARIEVDSVELVPFASMTAADIRRSGEKDRESLRQRAAHAGPITDDTLLYRVEFHLVQSQAR